MSIHENDLKEFRVNTHNRRQAIDAQQKLIDFKKTWQLGEYKYEDINFIKVLLFITLLLGIFYLVFKLVLVDSNYEKAINAYSEADYINSIKYFEISCDEGNGESCNYLGVMYNSGNEIPKDDIKAISYYSKSCQLKNSHGCYNLEQMAKQTD